MPVWTREAGRGLVIDDKERMGRIRLQTLPATVSLDYCCIWMHTYTR
jgi:hypothetical protein